MSTCNNFHLPKRGDVWSKGDTVSIEWSTASTSYDTAIIGLVLNNADNGFSQVIVDELELVYNTAAWMPTLVPCTPILGEGLTKYTPGSEMYYNWTLPEDLDVTDSSYVISYFNRSVDAANQNLFSSSVFSIRGYQSSLTTTSAQSAATSAPTTTTSATPVTTSSKSPSFSTGAKIGVSIGVCLTLLLLSMGAYIFLRRRRRGCGTSGTCVQEKTGFEKPELDSVDTQHRVELHAEARGHCSPEIAHETEWRLEKEPAELPA